MHCVFMQLIHLFLQLLSTFP